MAELTQKQLQQSWNDYVENIRKQTALFTGETPEQQKKRISILEADFELWCKYYFPQYCYAEPADFHKEASKRVLNNPEWYEVRNWSRELAKDVRTMFETLFLMLTGQKHFMIMTSSSYDAAEKFLKPYKGNLEANQRIIHDYGEQMMPGEWADGAFTTRKGASFSACGAGQSPRGSRHEHIRPDILIINDIDTDQDCRNNDLMDEKWDWVEQALLGTRSISKDTLIIFLGNLIAENCCVARAAAYADKQDIQNIRNADGKSNWWQKNTEEMIDRVLSLVSYATQQKEYYNNPLKLGKVFKEVTYGKCPEDVPVVIVYADPASSDKDKPNVKAQIQNSCKAVMIVGYFNSVYYVYKMFVQQTTNANFIEWLYTCRQWIKDNFSDKTQAYFYIENNTLQDPFYQQVLLPLIRTKGEDLKETILGITPDERDKPDKYFRIEGTLEPLNRNGHLVFNIDEKNKPHMNRTETQFKSVSTNSKTMDAPDAVEGAVYILQQKLAMLTPGQIKLFKRKKSKHRF